MNGSLPATRPAAAAAAAVGTTAVNCSAVAAGLTAQIDAVEGRGGHPAGVGGAQEPGPGHDQLGRSGAENDA